VGTQKWVTTLLKLKNNYIQINYFLWKQHIKLNKASELLKLIFPRDISWNFVFIIISLSFVFVEVLLVTL
jgi:hypothetical protein